MNKNLIVIGSLVLLVGVILFFALTNTDKKREKLIDWANALPTDSIDSKARAVRAYQLMSKNEINSTYKFIFNYPNNKNIPDSLRSEINAITKKYGIFT